MGAVLVDIVVYISVGLAVSLLARQYEFNQILGYIIAGIFLGPSGFNVISLENWSHSAGEYGVVFLLFTMGLSVTWDKLWELRFYALVIGTLQVALCFCAFAALLSLLGANLGLACLLGSLFAFSSTAVIGQLLAERNEFSSEHGRVTISILLFQDFAVLFVLILVNIPNLGSVDIFATLFKALSKAVMMLLGCATLWKFVLRPLYRWVGATRSSDLLVSMMLLIILLLALLTEMAGLSPELGAFLAGMLLGDTEYQSQVDVDIKPFKHLLLGLFFITIGMRVNISLFLTNMSLVLTVFAVFSLIKFGVLLALLRWVGRIAQDVSWRAACVLAGGSEFGILILQRGQEIFLFTNQLTEIFSFVLILSLALTPALSRLARFGFVFRKKGAEQDVETQEPKSARDHVVIAGVGEVGTKVLEALDELHIPYIAIDNNVKRVGELSEEREGVFYGDARKIEVLKIANIKHAKILIVCMDYFKSAERIMSLMTRHYPEVSMVVRVKKVSQVAVAKQYGATTIAPDAFVLGGDIVGHVMRAYSFAPDRVEKVLQNIRRYI